MKVRIWLFLFTLTFLSSPIFGGIPQDKDLKEKIESAFLLTILKQVEFPSHKKELKLLVLQKPGDSKEIYRQVRSTFKGKSFRLNSSRSSTFDVDRQTDLDNLSSYDIVLITNEFHFSSQKVLNATKGKSILLIGENRQFQYCMINLLAHGAGGRFEMNENLMLARGFSPSEKLKEMATKSREQYSNEVEKYEDSINDVNREKQLKERELASKSEMIGNLERSNEENLNKSLALQDSLSIAEQMAALQKEKVAQQSELISRQEKIMSQQRYMITISVIAAILILFFLYLAYASRNKVKKQNQEISEQKEQLQTQNKEILDSLGYAKRIQSAILPPKKIVKENLDESFILYKPKDIVAGDFYWMESFAKTSTSKGVLFAAADCTGHGVPGAMVSVVCNNGLNRSVREFGLTDPGRILDKTREIVLQEFEKSEDGVKDGMDIALVSLMRNENEKQNEEDISLQSFSLCFSGANNPLWLIRKGHIELEDLKESFSAETIQHTRLTQGEKHTLIEIKADKQPIGDYYKPKPYKSHEIDLKPGDSFYLFSDGYADQFGGVKGKKFKSQNFKKLLLSIQEESMEKQQTILDQKIENWRGDIEQVDDICVIGVRI